MSVTINGDTGIDKVQDGSIVNADLATGIDAAKLTGTLPAIDGSSLTNLPQPAALSTATSSTSQPSYSVRAWIKWNGNIGGGINGSGGVSSFSRGGTGDYDIFWSVTLDDANYAVTCCSGEQRVDRGLSSNGLATNKVTMVYEDTGGTRVDGGDLCIMMIR